MRISDFSGTNENVCILGIGKEGQAAFRTLEKHAPDIALFVADVNPVTNVSNAAALSGTDYLDQIERMNFWKIIKSPGVPPHPLIDKWRKEGRLTSGTQIFLDSIADSGATVIGVTGSKGKSTTATLIYEILAAAGKDAHLIGNIGKPAIEFLEHAKPGTVFVMEMSSYQLMDLTVSPQIAVVTSFFPEHLDYHGSLEAYKEAKKHIARFQRPEDVIVFDGNSDGAREIAMKSAGQHIAFTAADAPVTLAETKLRGVHNLSNIAAAFAVASRLGIPRDTCVEVFQRFEGLPHRLQSLGTHHGIEWVDDAISTTPQSTIAALDALGNRISTIMLGGQDRGNDFTELGKRIADSQIRNVILFPGSGTRIFDALKQANADVKYFNASSMEEAVAHAKQHTEPGCVSLLSPASPSYGMFKNFEEKGSAFKTEIHRQL